MTYLEAFERAQFAAAVTGATVHLIHDPKEGQHGYGYTDDEDIAKHPMARCVVTFRPSVERELHDKQTAQVRGT